MVAGESGRPRLQARTFNIRWCRVVRYRCNVAGTPFFMKQIGSRAVNGLRPYTTRYLAGADPAEWPADIRAREYPTS